MCCFGYDVCINPMTSTANSATRALTIKHVGAYPCQLVMCIEDEQEKAGMLPV